jgi:hypothetical protein
MIAGESMTGQMLLGAGVVVGSVVLITSQNTHDPEPDETVEDACVAEPRFST